MTSWVKKTLVANKTFFIFITLMVVFRSAIADWNDVPTGSMNPTIIEGDRILVNKLAYDIHLPLSHISIKKLADPKRGDIIIFDSKVSDKRLVKRVIGIPGDTVSLNANQLIINGQHVNYKPMPSAIPTAENSEIYTENLLGVDHQIQTKLGGSSLSNFNSVIVPKDHYLAMGDNRDNSADSRVIGFVPRTEIIGRSSTVVMSLNYKNYFLPRKNRFLHTL